MKDANDDRWERANSRSSEWMARKIGEDSKKRETEEEGERLTKRQRQGGPQPEMNEPRQEGDVAEKEARDRKRKATEEMQHDERQASKAAAVGDEATGAEGMQDLNAASVDVRGMVLNQRKKKRDFSRRSDRNEVRERVNKNIGPEIYSALGKHSSREETKARSRMFQNFVMEVIKRQKEGGRMYVHEFPEGAGSVNTKESIHVRTDECNKEGRTGRWRAGESGNGDIRMMTNVREVLDEIQKIGGVVKKRTVDMVGRRDSHGEEICRKIMRGMARGLRTQGRINPGEEGMVMAVEENNWEVVL